jgi:hypothetical protein
LLFRKLHRSRGSHGKTVGGVVSLSGHVRICLSSHRLRSTVQEKNYHPPK